MLGHSDPEGLGPGTAAPSQAHGCCTGAGVQMAIREGWAPQRYHAKGTSEDPLLEGNMTQEREHRLHYLIPGRAS